jgi:hypothetical protein
MRLACAFATGTSATVGDAALLVVRESSRAAGMTGSGVEEPRSGPLPTPMQTCFRCRTGISSATPRALLGAAGGDGSAGSGAALSNTVAEPCWPRIAGQSSGAGRMLAVLRKEVSAAPVERERGETVRVGRSTWRSIRASVSQTGSALWPGMRRCLSPAPLRHHRTPDRDLHPRPHQGIRSDRQADSVVIPKHARWELRLKARASRSAVLRTVGWSICRGR